MAILKRTETTARASFCQVFMDVSYLVMNSSCGPIRPTKWHGFWYYNIKRLFLPAECVTKSTPLELDFDNWAFYQCLELVDCFIEEHKVKEIYIDSYQSAVFTRDAVLIENLRLAVYFNPEEIPFNSPNMKEKFL